MQKTSTTERTKNEQKTKKQTAVQPYGAFVDIGAASDGLVHISHLSTEFVSSVAAIVQQGQAVSVRVLSVDTSTGKIALSMVPEGEERSRGGGDRDRERGYHHRRERDRRRSRSFEPGERGGR